LRYYVYTLLSAGKKMQADAKTGAWLAGTAADLRPRLLLALERVDFTLTKEAWRWIEQETDKAVLRQLILASVIKTTVLEVCNLRSALLENKALCHDVVRLMRNRRVFEETAREVEAEFERYLEKS
jgi:hypothetical protein